MDETRRTYLLRRRDAVLAELLKISRNEHSSPVYKLAVLMFSMMEELSVDQYEKYLVDIEHNIVEYYQAKEEINGQS